MDDGIEVSTFWLTGDINTYLPHQSGAYGYQKIPIALFGVRFDPDGIKELLPEKLPVRQTGSTSPIPQPIDPPPDPAPVIEETPEVSRGPAVSDALLKEWYALYQRAYTGAADTEATAIKSAQGMFPGKHVARQRVRALRGEQRRGRKPSDPKN